MEVKDLIKTRRKALGLSQQEVAKHVGVSDGTISRWESGFIENMGRGHIVKLAKVLGVSPSAILGWENDEDEHQDLIMIRERMRRQPGMRTLFDAANGATEEELERYTDVIKALRKSYDDD